MANMVMLFQPQLRQALGGSSRFAAEGKPAAHQQRPSEVIVSVVLPRGAVCIAVVHAIMLEGRAYNCFDLANPREVLAAQLEVGRPPVVVSNTAVAHRLDLDSMLPPHTTLLDTESNSSIGFRKSLSDLNRSNSSTFALASSGDRLAYVIFTSGSTGKPKAVMIEHHSACNQVRVFGESYGMERDDRVCQSISMAFDPHVNEVFGTLRWGAALVVMSDAVKRSGPDMLPWIVDKHISVLTMTPSGYRMMMSADADVSRVGLPDLRVCGSGGEALGKDVLDHWAVGRHFFNLYGPTETTITSVMTELKPGDPIVIGRSLPSYQNVVLDKDTLKPVARGEQGVLFTAGPGVARGYLNDEEKTRDRFIEVAGLGRAYNTGDVVLQDEAGNFHWIGRADFQVKVRGNRIELEYLEHAISNVSGVTHCEARVVGGGARLVLLASGDGVTEDMLREAASKLGRAYELSYVKLVPNSVWTFTVNGKLKRNEVPLEEEAVAPPPPPADESSAVDQLSSSELSALGTAGVAVALAKGLGVALQSPDDDFFASGGTSVTAATLVSKLRQLGKRESRLERLKGVTVRDIYECRTMGALAELLGDAPSGQQGGAGAAPARGAGTGRRRFVLGRTRSKLELPEDVEVIGTERFYLVGFLQCSWIVLELMLVFMAVIKLSMLWHSLNSAVATWQRWIILVALVFFLVPIVIICQSLLVKAVKLVLCFRPKGCVQIRLWSLPYFKWWLIHHLQDLIPTILIAGTPFAALWARLMGAKIGQGVVLWQVPKNADLELLELGDFVSVGQESFFNTTHAEKGMLILGPIAVGTGASIGCRVNVAQNSVIEAWADVEDLALVTGTYSASAPADLEGGCGACGAAAAADGAAPAPGAREVSVPSLRSMQGMGCLLGFAMLPIIGIMVTMYSFVLPMQIATRSTYHLLIDELFIKHWNLSQTAQFFLSGVIWVVLSQLVAVALVVAAKWLLVGRMRPGAFSVNSLKYWRFWLTQTLLNFVSSWLPLTLMTVYYPVVMRLLGARVGLKSEFGAFTFGYCPDLLQLGDGVFLADRCSVGGIQIRGGQCELKETKLEKRTFVGNCSVVKAGSRLGKDVLVGIMSVAPEVAENGTSWLGVPPIELPGRNVDESPQAKKQYTPPCYLFAVRLFTDFVRGQVPSLIIMHVIFAFKLGPDILMTKQAYEMVDGLKDFIDRTSKEAGQQHFWVWRYYVDPYAQTLDHDLRFWALAGLNGVLCILLAVIVIVLLKWLANCKVTPGTHMLYSWKVTMCGFNLALQTVAFPVVQLSFGTPLAGLYFRLMGSSIGKRVYINTMFIGEPDLVTLGDGACLNRMSNLGTHTFEDRLFKLGNVTLEEDTAVGCESAVLRGASLRQRAVLEDSSLCMVDEELLRGRHRGCPSQRCA